jgi:glucose-1-phosphate thymidylyltransferase
MKGVILAGGNGTRLLPMTKAVNKHLLPVGGKPMLQHCVEKMTKAGINDILIVTGGNHLGGIAEFLGSGKEFGCNVTYRVQDEAGGIAQALALAEGFANRDSICVLLGDNIFKDSLGSLLSQYERSDCQGAMVVLKPVPDPSRFGVACTLGATDKVLKIVEKPKFPESSLAVTGIYFYDEQVFGIIRTCKPSDRGELEITDVNNAYIRLDQLHFTMLSGWWTDAGTPESYLRANDLVRGRRVT